MPIYVHQCPVSPEHDQCPSFEQLRPMSESQAPAPCPTCGELAPRVLRGVQVLIPAHFQNHVRWGDTKADLGSGEWEDLNRRLRRWNGR